MCVIKGVFMIRNEIDTPSLIIETNVSFSDSDLGRAEIKQAQDFGLLVYIMSSDYE